MCFHSALNQCTQKMSFLSLPRIQEESSQCPLEFCNSCWRIKRFLYSFFRFICIEIWDDTNPFCTAILRAVFCKSLHWMLAVVSRFFMYFAWNSFSSASSTLFFILDELQSPETAFTNPPLIVFYQWKWYCCLEYCVEGAQQYRTRQGVKALNP